MARSLSIQRSSIGVQKYFVVETRNGRMFIAGSVSGYMTFAEAKSVMEGLQNEQQSSR